MKKNHNQGGCTMTSIRTWLLTGIFCLFTLAACNVEELPSERAKEEKAQRDKHEKAWLKANEERARSLHRAEWPGEAE